MVNILIFLISCLASLIQVTLGFGYGMIGMALFPLFAPYNTSLVLCTITAPISNIIAVTKYKKGIAWKKLWRPLIGALVFSTLISVLAVSTGDTVMMKCLGGFLFLLGIVFLFFKNKIKVGSGNISGTVCGLVSGIMGGLFGVNGPPAAMYFLAASDGDNGSYISTSQLYFFILNIYLTALRFINGERFETVLIPSLFSFAGVAVGALLGLKLFKKVNGAFLYRYIYIFIAAMGIYMMVR